MKRPIGFARLAIVAMVVSGGTLGALAPPVYGIDFFSSKKVKIKDEDSGDFDTFDVKTKVPMVGDFTTVYGQEKILIQGAGLVVGLDGTGEDPPPSPVREIVLADMKRRGIPNPARLLKSTNIAVVIVTAYLPPLSRKGDRFDVEVRMPDGSKARSLAGGWLLPTYLAEHMFVPGVGDKKSNEYATASGAILVTAAHGGSADTVSVLRRGIIVAGGVAKKERDLSLFLRSSFRSERNTIRIANAIGQRFFDYDKYGQRIKMAEAKTDQKIALKVLTKYRDNYPRYLDVIRKISFRETEVARQIRIHSLKDELLNPETASHAGLSLEAIGDKAVPILKAGLSSKDAEVRFHSAVALAYLGDASGLDALVDAAKNEYAFRVFALAAMSCLDDPEVSVRLRELMNVDSAETRYGAFRALTTLDKNDPFVRGQKISDQFRLHVLPTGGPPMVHITNRRKAEIVVFGSEQKLLTPVAARAGTRIMVTGAHGLDQVTVTRFELGRDDKRKVVPNRVADVIQTMTELGASFPDVAQFLAEVNSQKNLQGRLEIDALPQAGRFYERKDMASADNPALREKKRVGSPMSVPNLFAIEADKAVPKKNKEGEAADVAETSSKRDKRGKKSSDWTETPTKRPKPVDDGGEVVTADLKTVEDDAADPAATVKPAAFEQPATEKAKVEAEDSPIESSGQKSPNQKPAAQKSDVQKPDSQKPDEARSNDEAANPPATEAPPRRSSGIFRGFFRFFDFNRGPSGNTEP